MEIQFSKYLATCFFKKNKAKHRLFSLVFFLLTGKKLFKVWIMGLQPSLKTDCGTLYMQSMNHAMKLQYFSSCCFNKVDSVPKFRGFLHYQNSHILLLKKYIHMFSNNRCMDKLNSTVGAGNEEHFIECGKMIVIRKAS